MVKLVEWFSMEDHAWWVYSYFSAGCWTFHKCHCCWFLGHPTGRRLLAQLIDCCCSVRDELDNGGGILGLLPARTCMSAFKHSHRCKITPTHSGDRRFVVMIYIVLLWCLYFSL